MTTAGGAKPKVTMAKALNAALRDAMADDERVVVLGEDVGQLGGVFRITDGLLATFGEKRCFDTPLAEAGIVGFAVGRRCWASAASSTSRGLWAGSWRCARSPR